MDIVILLIVASMSLAVLFLCCFIWAVGRGQFDDLQTPALRVLFEDVKASGRS